MAVEIAELIPSLKREVNPPGSDLYPTVTNGMWLGYLQDAFWEAKLANLFTGHTIDPNDDAMIVPMGGEGTADDLPRPMQQLIVLFAGFRITLNKFQNLKSQFRAQAGPVSFEQGQSAQTLKSVLDAIRERMKVIIDGLPSEIGTGYAAVFDGVIERSYSVAGGDTWWVR